MSHQSWEGAAGGARCRARRVQARLAQVPRPACAPQVGVHARPGHYAVCAPAKPGGPAVRCGQGLGRGGLQALRLRMPLL